MTEADKEWLKVQLECAKKLGYIKDKLTDEQIKELAKKAWRDYWKVTQLAGFASKFPESIVPFLEILFKAGYLEGYRNCEELADK